MDAGRLAQSLRAEREAWQAMMDMAERERLALRLLGSKLASLHACILQEPDGGCGDVDVEDCRKGCASCWCVWAELEAGRLRERRRRRDLEQARARAGERRRPMVPVVPEDMSIDEYMRLYGAD